MKLRVRKHPKRSTVLDPCIFIEEAEVKNVNIGGKWCRECKFCKEFESGEWVDCEAVHHHLDYIDKLKYNKPEK